MEEEPLGITYAHGDLASALTRLAKALPQDKPAYAMVGMRIRRAAFRLMKGATVEEIMLAHRPSIDVLIGLSLYTFGYLHDCEDALCECERCKALRTVSHAAAGCVNEYPRRYDDGCALTTDGFNLAVNLLASHPQDTQEGDTKE